MKTKRAARIWGILFAFMMVFTTVFCTNTAMAGEPGQTGFQATGFYIGTIEKYVDAMESNIHYDVRLTLKSDGSYDYLVNYTVKGAQSAKGTEKDSGKYTQEGSTLTGTSGSLKSGKIENGKASITVVPSSYASGATETIEVTWQEPGKKFQDVLTSGNYVLTEDSYCEEALMKMPVYIVIDAGEKTFKSYPYYGEGQIGWEENKGSGTISFDADWGIYTLTYDGGSTESIKGKTSTFTATAEGITFTSPMYYGIAKMNTTDENDYFVPYTAKRQADAQPDPAYEDVLKSGNYVLTEESYYEGALMKMPIYIVINAEAKTFAIHPYTNGVADLNTDKGSGNYAFDPSTGVYTMNYTAGTTSLGKSTTFTATADSITFTSPLKYGGAQMNTVNEEGEFVPYTAKKPSEGTPEKTYEDVLKSSSFVLTEDSYDASAMMKMPAYIVIDAEAKTFAIHPYKNGAADLNTDKGSGTITFDSKTGVYTMTYVSGSVEGASTTFTAAGDSITFTSPMYYGKAKMNTVDEGGKFIPYTAKKAAEEKPESPTKPAEEYQDVLVSGNYVLTADSYDASAMMKLPAYIVIDAQAKTFRIHPYADGAADLNTNKGSGTISFDKTTGVYTMTYKEGVKEPGVTSTFTATADGITFTSPMYYGIAKMNTADESGNFIPYTAKLMAGVNPEEPTTEPSETEETAAPSETEEETAAPSEQDDTTSPQTGDSSNPAVWIVLLAISGAGVAAVCCSRRKAR